MAIEPGRERQALEVDRDPHVARASDVRGVGGQSVGEIDHRAERRPARAPAPRASRGSGRTRRAVQLGRVAVVPRACLALGDRESGRRATERPGDADEVARAARRRAR